MEITKLEKKNQEENKDFSLQIDNKDPMTYLKLKVYNWLHRKKY